MQNPVRLGDISESEPDLSIVRPRSDFYRSRHPRAADALLLIEVAETSADADRTIKASLYARAGIPEFWLVDLAAGVIDVYSGPDPATGAITASCGPANASLRPHSRMRSSRPPKCSADVGPFGHERASGMEIPMVEDDFSARTTRFA